MFFGLNKFTTIDIGSFYIKIARFKKHKHKLSLLKHVYKELPPETIKEGRIIDTSIVSSTIEEIFHELSYRPNRIITTISYTDQIIRNVELPLMSDDELKEALKWEVEDYLPFDVEQAVLDYISIKKDEDEKSEEDNKILLVASKKEIVKNYLEPFKKMSIDPSVINVQPMALLSLLSYQGKLEQAVAIVDIGMTGSRIIIGDSNNIYISREIDTAGESFTRTIMESLDINHKEAEKHKKENGINNDMRYDESEEFNWSINQMATGGFNENSLLISLAKTISEEISRSLTFFSNQHRGKIIDDLYITGGGFNLKGLKEILENELGVNIYKIDSFEGIELNEEISDDENNYFAIVTGLAASEVLEK